MYSRWFIQCILLLLVVVVKIDSESRFRTEFLVPEEDDYLPSIPQGGKEPYECICMPIRRCNSLRNRTDWRTVGETCFGYGEYRGVCCPETSTYNDGECGYSGVQSYSDSVIVKGGNASEGSWPWMVGIGTIDSSGFYSPRCSGFLIDRRHLISAAQCYQNGRNFTARIGNVNQEEADEYRITRFLVHPDYNVGLFYDDIAILTLDREVNSPSFNPVCLPDDEVGRMNLDGRAATVVGWGNIYRGKMQMNLKYWTGLRVISGGECQEIFRRFLRTTFDRQFPRGMRKKLLCAGYADGDKLRQCPNSGGPLMVQNGNRWFAVGITSFGFKCGRPGIPEGFTNIANYLDWISRPVTRWGQRGLPPP